ncbi:Negative elongation factor A [Plasmopara halstedii]|uniref:Negative elongation factor A n=1 Tax=Plasmopara halstedii TaxID=4781 RepID=A0A0P1B1U0_PLAHL|nr:Negative elongation factor A [Plasmopara halstedii]CEG48073.1 Negative elongation factor A [Plasmopara halstedii]|eukprot:XP_024584442.1 Negative elongation factor A [Plasmopara halstedii]
MPSSRSDTQLLEKDASFDAWMIQKLRSDWNAHEFGGLLTPLKLAEARTRFSHQETLIKVRLLLSLLSIRYDEVNGVSSKKEVRALLEITEKDGDEWVKVISGIVKQFLELDTNGQSSDSYHHAQLENTVLKVIQAVAIPSKRHKNSNLMILDDVFTFENGLLNTSLRSQTTPTAAIHFTVSGDKDDGHDKDEDVDVSPVKKPLYRPQIPRPSGLVPSSIASTSSITRLNQTSKFSMGKKNLSELSSEIRRKADAGRFKRQRSRISMIDINEVKQIESEKAQKAEERKKQKLAAKEKEKEKLAKEKEREKIAASEKTGTGHGLSVTNNDEHAAIAADIFAMHHQLGQDESISHYSQQQLQMEEMTDMNIL